MEGEKNETTLYSDKFRTFAKKTNIQNSLLKESIEVLKGEDEITILNTLYSLSTELSMANDAVADDPNCQGLIKQLVVLLDKFVMLPDISCKLTLKK
jgi:hypothetical protein